MLQKGFLTSERDTQEMKKSRGYFMLGGAICFLSGVVLIMLGKIETLGLSLIGVGAVLMSIGLWKNVMAQNKSRRPSKRRK